ncbi:helix-turn-helix domain-containing protein [Pseudacidovorax intermedius]|uniref:helix-turn-helix domain-containing protein n=1 Tax=Pseudacidovorax intermedius TaxID=433924 RepID=UPI0026ED6239|nr:helix-turn-helix domain-containing protein [Pseudacidovorax intermedius]
MLPRIDGALGETGWSLLRDGWVLVAPDGFRLRLNLCERAILSAMVCAPQHALSLGGLIELLTQTRANFGQKPLATSSMRMILMRLMKKLERSGAPCPILSVHGWGYRLRVGDEPAGGRGQMVQVGRMATTAAAACVPMAPALTPSRTASTALLQTSSFGESLTPSTGTLTLSGGLTVNAGGWLDLGSSGKLVLGGGTSNVTAIKGAGTITLNPGATLNLGAAVAAPGVDVVMAGGTLNVGVNAHSLGTLTQTASSSIGFGSGGKLTVSLLGDLGSGLTLTASNWVAGSTGFYATSVSGSPAPARNTLGLPTLNQVKLGSNAASLTYWSSGTNELLAGPPPGAYTYWDTNPNLASIDGGDGNWDGTSANWTTSSGSPNGSWTGGNVATFGGTAGTVTVTAAQSIGGMTFATGGYILGGSQALTLAGGHGRQCGRDAAARRQHHHRGRRGLHVHASQPAGGLHGAVLGHRDAELRPGARQHADAHGEPPAGACRRPRRPSAHLCGRHRWRAEGAVGDADGHAGQRHGLDGDGLPGCKLHGQTGPDGAATGTDADDADPGAGAAGVLPGP